MAAPAHLLPILDALGDGGTVPMAETVHQLIEEARAGTPVDPAAWQSGYVGRDVYDAAVRRAEDLQVEVEQLRAELDRTSSGSASADTSTTPAAAPGPVAAGEDWLADLADDDQPQPEPVAEPHAPAPALEVQDRPRQAKARTPRRRP